jgi:hypothetical protein
MRFLLLLALICTATICTAVEYAGGELFTFNDGHGVPGIHLARYSVIVTWTSRGGVDGPVYGISVQPFADVQARKPLQGNHPVQAFPVRNALFEPDAAAMSAKDPASISAPLGLPVERQQAATATLAAIKAEAMKRIKP